ncbi:MAG: hypothetical protein R6X14_09020 [bacterium]
MVLVLAASVLGSCAGSSASYTRFRARAAEGRVVDAEEVRASEMINYLAQADAPRPPVTAPGAASGLAIVAELGNPVLPAARRSQPVLQVSLRGTASVVRPPATIVLAVDLSGSMNAEESLDLALGSTAHRGAEGLLADIDRRDGHQGDSMSLPGTVKDCCAPL